MSRLVPALSIGCIAAITATAYAMLSTSEVDKIGAPERATASAATAVAPAAVALHEARRKCSLPALDVVVQDLRARCTAQNEDAGIWHLLALALLERVQMRSHRRGLTVGTPVWAELPADLAADVDAGLAAATRARELGHDDSDLYRIEACLMSQRITGLGAAMRWNPRIQAALAKAVERAKDDPSLHIALGLRKLLAPRLLGHDPVGALAHFEFAALCLVDDERPAVFAAMASHLQKKRVQAMTWLEQAVARNPNNVFARVVLQRVRRDEPDPFGRDVTNDEAAEGK